MACEGATGNTCTGIVTGEDLVIKTPTTLTDLVVSSSEIAGTLFTISWTTTAPFPAQTVRVHLRKKTTVVGYVPLDIEIVARDIGEVSFEVEVGQEYYIWLRAETDTGHGVWYFGTFLAEDGVLEVPNLALWRGAVITYNGETVVYRSDTEANFLNIYALEG